MSKLLDPDFRSDGDIFVKATEQNQRTDDDVSDLTLNANILIFSYNRPVMLREAINSVINQSYEKFMLYIIDDGSDVFNAVDLIEEYDDERIVVVQAPQITMEERVSRSRLGENANTVIRMINGPEPVYYLCDDDLFHPHWLGRSVRMFQEFPDEHVVQGEAWYFNENEGLSSAIYGMPRDEPGEYPMMYWSTGSFAHRAYCSLAENLWWTDSRFLHSQDTNFINDLWDLHQNWIMITAPAVYRREHENTLSAKLGRKDKLGKYKLGFVPPPATQAMLERME